MGKRSKKQVPLLSLVAVMVPPCSSTMILAIAKDPEVGEEFTGNVVRILDFGAFVELAPGKDGLIHISKLAKERVEKVTDVVNIGDTVVVKVIKIDEKGRIDLKLVKKL